MARINNNKIENQRMDVDWPDLLEECKVNYRLLYGVSDCWAGRVPVDARREQ